jgi:hypothetical protein
MLSNPKIPRDLAIAESHGISIARSRPVIGMVESDVGGSLN